MHEAAPELLHEVRRASEIDGRFRRAILDRAREVVPATIPDALLPRLAEFLVSEIPVLCSLYYARGEPGVVDVYPGENSPELNPVENIWQYLRANWLSNRVFETYDAIIDAACDLGESSSPNRKRSHRSERAIGQTSVSPYDRQYYCRKNRHHADVVAASDSDPKPT